jgi:signal transduction histidine kinase/ActR/RegA family two-component response regulator
VIVDTTIINLVFGIILGIFALVGWIMFIFHRGRISKARQELQGRKQTLAEVESELNQLHETEGIKAKFFLSLSNELRTPLNSILGFSEMLMTSDTTPEQDEYIQAIQGSGNDLLHVMSNLIDYAHIHARSLIGNRSQFDFAQLIHDLSLEIETAAKRKGLVFSVEGDYNKNIILNTDKTYLYTLLYNLLVNAVKFTDNGAVTLRVNHSVQSQPKDDNILYRITVEIEDTGIGISEEDQPNIFAPFYQVERIGEGTRGGLGLGLAVVKKLTSFFNGTIEYTTLVPGSKFTLKIALPGVGRGLTMSDRQRSLRMSGKKTSVGESFYKHHVLIAEDMPSNSRLLQVMLNKMGHTYDVATNGQEAVVAAKNKAFDVILMDIRMPLLSGTIAAKMIRGGKMGDLNTETPIVALTALASEQEKQELTGCGIERCLTKPVKVDQLRSMLTEIAREKLQD